MEKSKITVKGARVNAGFTQQEMADKLQISRGKYISLEQNPENFTIKLATAFANEVGLTIDDIIFSANSTLSRVS